MDLRLHYFQTNLFSQSFSVESMNFPIALFFQHFELPQICDENLWDASVVNEIANHLPTCGDINEENKYLVGGIPTPLKNMKVNGKDYPIYYGK